MSSTVLKRSLRPVLVAMIVLISLAGTPSYATCERWQCLRSYDLAFCLLSGSPRSGRSGSECQEVQQCMWSINENGSWILTCPADCVINACYEV